MAKLSTTVHVGGVAYGPGEDIPSEVSALISNPNVWEGDAPSNAGSEVKPPQTFPLPAVNQAPKEDSGIPPKGGPGSGRAAWVAYAVDHGVEVPEEATREYIVTLLDASDVPTE